MKCLTLIIHESSKQEMIDIMVRYKDISGYTIMPVEGHTVGMGQDPFESNRDRVVGYVPRMRLDVVGEYELLQSILSEIRSCETCIAGKAVYWFSSIDEYGQL